MHTVFRWLLAIVLVLIGTAVALFAWAVLQFLTWSCYSMTNDIAKVVLNIAATVSFIAPITPAVMLIRKSAGKSVWIAVGLSFLIILLFNGTFVLYTFILC